MTDPLPSLFITHGSPTLPIEDGPTVAFLRGLGARLPRPRAVLVVTAHWEADRPTLGAAARPETVHDFHGFPDALYALRYPAPGAPTVATAARDLLVETGFPATIDEARGLDHGTWVPLLLMYPDADIPVAQLSVQTALGPAHHIALGRALSPLRADGVLIVGSGSATHNLRAVRWNDPAAPAPGFVTAFDDWVIGKVTIGAVDDLCAYRELAPHARTNHPTEEHFLPLFAALGAGWSPAADDPAPRGQVLHRATTWGALAMTAYAFGGTVAGSA